MSASGPKHPSEDLHSVGGDVTGCVDRFLPNHSTIEHHFHRRLTDGYMELCGRQRMWFIRDILEYFPNQRLIDHPCSDPKNLELMIKQQPFKKRSARILNIRLSLVCVCTNNNRPLTNDSDN